MWKPDLHPRDEYGRFRLVGSGGVLDRMAAQAEAHQHAQNIAEVDALWQKQFNFYQPLQRAGQLTPELDHQWDWDIARRQELERQLPEAHHKGLVPHQDGTWRKANGLGSAYDAQGNKIPLEALRGSVRVGDHPSGTYRGEHPASGGVWHRPGEYGPGRVPVLRNDYGNLMSQLAPERAKSRKHRDVTGMRNLPGELKAEKVVGRRGERYPLAPEELAAHLASGLNPVGRRRTARMKRKRQQTTTWIQHLSSQMEGNRG